MRQITTREKIFLSAGFLAAVAIFVYFILWPLLQSGGSEQASSLEEMQGKLESVEELADMEPLLLGMEKRIKEQSGYGKVSFKRGIADSMIIKYIADAAANADIKELEQLDAKPDTSRKARTETKSEQAALRPIVDQMYLVHVLEETEREASSTDERADPGATGGPGNVEQTRQEDSDPDEGEMDQSEEPADQDAPTEPEPSRSTGDMEQVESQKSAQALEKLDQNDSNLAQPLKKVDENNSDSPLANTRKPNTRFPPLPKDIPDEVRQSMVGLIEERQGKTPGLADINAILDNVELEDQERGRVRKRLQLHCDRVKENKNEMARWLSKALTAKNSETDGKVGKFSVKMIFKSQMEQLVKLLYNLQDSAKWLKVEAMRVTVSDRKETVLSVEISMTATVLYDI